MDSRGSFRDVYVLASDSQLQCGAGFAEHSVIEPDTRKLLTKDSKFVELQIGNKRCLGNKWLPGFTRSNAVFMKMHFQSSGSLASNLKGQDAAVRITRSATGVRQHRRTISNLSDTGVAVSHLDCPVPLRRKLATINLTETAVR